MSRAIENIGIVGSGNVAWHLAHGLKDAGLSIKWIHSRNTETGNALASSLLCNFDKTFYPENVDLCLICTNDESIQAVLDEINSFCPVAYTSGIKAINDLKFTGEDLGVFYPLQTFSKEGKLNLFEVPLFIEAKNQVFAQSLFDLGWKLSRKVTFASSTERQKLHLAAVLVNNFSNHLATLAKQFLDENELPFDHLKPLIQETSRKLQTMKPFDAQTGPAKRNDQSSINIHLSLIQGDTKQLYELFTSSIQKIHAVK